MNPLFKTSTSLLSLLTMMILLFSCGRREVKIPNDILAKQEMVPLLVDIHLAQAVVGMNQINDSTGYGMNDYLLSILQTHHLTKVKYEKSLAFYSSKPELLEGIYQEVINELSKKQGEVSVK